VAVLAVLLGALAIVGFTAKDDLAFTLGVHSTVPAVKLGAGQVLCQQPIVAPGGARRFDRVRVALGTYRQPKGPPLDVTIRTMSGRRLGGGVLSGTYPDIGVRRTQVVPVGRVIAREPFAACFRNMGRRPVAFFGNSDAAAKASTAFVDGRRAEVDIELVFEDAPRSFAAALPNILRRAAFWSPSWTSAVVLAVLALIGTALLLWALPSALVSTRTGDEEAGDEDRARGGEPHR
jgi:hypothetical protein